MTESTPTCVLIDDHPALRAGVRLRLEMDGVARIVAEASGGAEGLEALRIHAPDVALVDFRMPGMNGVEIIGAARAEGIGTRMVLLTALTERHLIEQAFTCGAHGFVGKDSEMAVLVQAIQAVLGDRRFVDPSLASALLEPSDDKLTAREMDVLRLMAAGAQNKVIALELALSEETVKTYVASILRKLDAGSRTHAVASALRSSLIQ